MLIKNNKRSFSLLVAGMILAAGCAETSVSDNAYASQSTQTAIHNGTILTINGDHEVIKDGVVIVEGSDIVAVGGAELLADYPDSKKIDADGGIVMPGMINTHNHLSMVAFRGIAESGIENIEQRLFDYFFPLEANLLNRDLIRISARHAAIELAMAGVTTTADMYYHEDEVAKSVKEVGIRGVLGETVIGFPVVDAQTPYGGLEYARAFIEEWQGDPLITPAVAPHAAYTVSTEKLLEAKALADELGAPMLMHIAEVYNEPEMVDRDFPNSVGDKSIIEFLDGIGFLGDNVLSAHTIFVSPTDIELLKERGVGIAHNPKANSKDMSGTSPGWDMYQAGLDIGLGTDGPMSSNQLDILTVMQHAARASRILNNDISKFEPRELVAMATIGGAKALDMEDKIGSLEPGKRADLIIVETKSPNMQPSYDPYATLVFSAYPGNVNLTMVNGRIVMKDREIHTADMAAHQKEWQGIVDQVTEFWEGMN